MCGLVYKGDMLFAYLIKGVCRRGTQSFRDQLDRASALALDVVWKFGKSPTEVPPGRQLPVALPSSICEFTSSSSPTPS